MKKQLFSILGIFLFVACLSLTSSAQDIIKRIDGKEIECKIVKIGEEEVIYLPYGLQNPPEISIDMSLVKKLVFETGYEYERKELKEAQVYRYEETYRNALKVGIFSPIGGTTRISYERLYDHRNSGEFGLLIHGLGLNNYQWEVAGIGLEYGHKFLMGGDFFSTGDSRNALGAFYFKPEILLGYLSYDIEKYDFTTNSTETIRAHNMYGGFYLNAGTQFIINKRFIIDLFFGVGPSFYDENKYDDPYNDNVSTYLLPVGGGIYMNPSNFSIKGGIKLGYAFGDKLNARKILRNKKW